MSGLPYGFPARLHQSAPYWLTLGKEVIWDYPKDFGNLAKDYPYLTDISAISDVIRDYVDTPVEQLLAKPFNDQWHLTEIFLAADRRIGKRKLAQLRKQVTYPGARAVLAARWDPKAREDS